MPKIKYAFAGDDYPRNTGSMVNPARVTIRCNCRERARWKKAVRRIAETFGETKEPQSEVFNRRILPMVEEFSWRQRLAKGRRDAR